MTTQTATEVWFYVDFLPTAQLVLALVGSLALMVWSIGKMRTPVRGSYGRR